MDPATSCTLSNFQVTVGALRACRSRGPRSSIDLSSTLFASGTITRFCLSVLLLRVRFECASPLGAWSLRVNKGAYIRRAPPRFYVRREHARARVFEVFPTGAAGPGPAAAAAVATGPRFGRPAQPLQADLPGPEQSADSHGDR